MNKRSRLFDVAGRSIVAPLKGVLRYATPPCRSTCYAVLQLRYSATGYRTHRGSFRTSVCVVVRSRRRPTGARCSTATGKPGPGRGTTVALRASCVEFGCKPVADGRWGSSFSLSDRHFLELKAAVWQSVAARRWSQSPRLAGVSSPLLDVAWPAPGCQHPLPGRWFEPRGPSYPRPFPTCRPTSCTGLASLARRPRSELRNVGLLPFGRRQSCARGVIAQTGVTAFAIFGYAPRPAGCEPTYAAAVGALQIEP
jgi:hypothetical protein